MSQNPDPDRGKCKSCGFLAKRTHSGFGHPPSADYEATPDERRLTVHFFTRWEENGRQRTVDFACFRHMANLAAEYRRDSESDRTTAAMVAIEKERNCKGWYPYKPGFSPTRHYEWYQEERREERKEEFEKWMENGRRVAEEQHTQRMLALHTELSEREVKLHTTLAESQRQFVLEREKLQEPTSRLMKRLTFVGIALAIVQVVAAIAALTKDSFLSRFAIWLWHRIVG
jgi:hypothetical protein